MKFSTFIHLSNPVYSLEAISSVSYIPSPPGVPHVIAVKAIDEMLEVSFFVLNIQTWRFYCVVQPFQQFICLVQRGHFQVKYNPLSIIP